MSLVYITKASMNLIVRSLRNKKNNISREYILSDIARDLSDEGIFSEKDINEILNTYELRDIYYTKMILKDFQQLLNSIEDNRNSISKFVEEENKKFAYSVKAPSYHMNESCEWKNKSFDNIEIPKQCVSDENNEIKIRSWIKRNSSLAFEELNKKFIYEFNCSEGLKQVSLKNSGTTDMENYRIEFKEKAKQCRLQLRFLLDGELGDKIANYRYAPEYKVENIVKYEHDPKLHKPILDFHAAKAELQKILFNFYKNKFNVDLSFNQSILDSIGFNPCKGRVCRGFSSNA